MLSINGNMITVGTAERYDLGALFTDCSRWEHLWILVFATKLLATDRSHTCTSIGGAVPRYFLAVSGTKQRPTGESRWEGWAVLRMVCHLDSISSNASFTDLWNLSPLPQPIKNGLSEVRASDLYPFVSRFIPDGWRWCSFWGVRLVDALIFPDDNFCKKKQLEGLDWCNMSCWDASMKIVYILFAHYNACNDCSMWCVCVLNALHSHLRNIVQLTSTFCEILDLFTQWPS